MWHAHKQPLIFRAALLAITLGANGCTPVTVLRDFTTDGCSLFPDGDAESPQRWRDCCVIHDMAYWRGGSSEERERADESLRNCVLARGGGTARAGLMYCGVRLGGHPVFPTWFRWGYGWSYGRGYVPLTADEQKLADEKLLAWRHSHPDGFCAAP